MKSIAIGTILLTVLSCDVHKQEETHLVQRIPVTKHAATTSTTSEQSTAEPTRIADAGRIVMPTPLKRVEPKFPEKPRAVTLIVLEGVVTTKGQMTNLNVIKGGDNTYTRAVVDAVRQWKFFSRHGGRKTDRHDIPGFGEYRRSIDLKCAAPGGGPTQPLHPTPCRSLPCSAYHLTSVALAV